MNNPHQVEIKLLFRASYLLFTVILVAGALNYSISLETMRSILGGYHPVVMLDMLRLSAGYYLALASYIAICLLPAPRLYKTRLALSVLLIVALTGLAHIAAVSVQLTSEAGSMDKLMFYSNYIGLNPAVFRVVTLFVFPALLLALLLIIFFHCLKNDARLKTVSLLYFCAGALFLFQAMLGPLQQSLPRSLTYHPVLYFIKTGYHPKKDVYHFNENANYKSVDIEGRKDSENQPNIVLIILESFRKDVSELMTHNREDEITPFLNQLAVNNSLVFENAFVTVPHTSKALVGIHCGILPFLDIPVYESTLGIPVRCLPDYLESFGFNTVYFQSPTEKYENRRELMRKIGYQEIYSAESFIGAPELRVNLLGFEDRVLLQPSLDWLQKMGRKDAPFLMTFLTGTTHRSYQPPEYFKKKYYSDSQLKNNYVNAVRYTDQFLSELFDNFKVSGFYENSVFILVSDHGEAFGEHGMHMHNNVPYNEVARIFFMIHDPSGNLPSGTHKNTVSQAQIMPTVLDILRHNFSVAQQPFDSVYKNKNYAFSACYEKLICVSLAKGNKKYIYNFDEKQAELFNLQDDPLELSNIAALHPEVVTEMHDALMQWYDFHQSAYHNFYRNQDPDYLSNFSDTVLYNLFDMHRSLRKIWPGNLDVSRQR